MAKKTKAKKTKGKFPYEKKLVRHIYYTQGGRKHLLYADEVVYTIRNKRDEGFMPAIAFRQGTDLLDEKIKLEMFDKDEIAKTRRE